MQIHNYTPLLDSPVILTQTLVFHQLIKRSALRKVEIEGFLDTAQQLLTGRLTQTQGKPCHTQEHTTEH